MAPRRASQLTLGCRQLVNNMAMFGEIKRQSLERVKIRDMVRGSLPNVEGASGLVGEDRG